MVEIGDSISQGSSGNVTRTGSFPPDAHDGVRGPASAIHLRRGQREAPGNEKTDPYSRGQLETLLGELRRPNGDEPPSSLAHCSGASCRARIDARSPSVKPLSLAAIADDSPPATSVVLWGMSGETYAKILRFSPAVSHWVVCGVDCPTSEIVAQCARLVG